MRRVTELEDHHKGIVLPTASSLLFAIERMLGEKPRGAKRSDEPGTQLMYVIIFTDSLRFARCRLER